MLRGLGGLGVMGGLGFSTGVEAEAEVGALIGTLELEGFLSEDGKTIFTVDFREVDVLFVFISIFIFIFGVTTFSATPAVLEAEDKEFLVFFITGTSGISTAAIGGSVAVISEVGKEVLVLVRGFLGITTRGSV
ncbi:hypothetical protein BZA77DRAFT_317634 [Pyronema omphalodes]|nr:hypothetical protein BZA77DRAFT_317634 [Pyronema omphalodes]